MLIIIRILFIMSEILLGLSDLEDYGIEVIIDYLSFACDVCDIFGLFKKIFIFCDI